MGVCGSSSTKVKAANDQARAGLKVDDTAEYRRAMAFISKVPIFKRLPKSDHPLLALASSSVELEKGHTFFKEGDMGHELFVIVEGEASVMVSTPEGVKVVATLRNGDYFGETALVRECPRTATIEAKCHTTALKIERKKFCELGLHQKLTFPNRKAVGVYKPQHQLVVKDPSPKTPAERDLISKALRGAEMLQQVVRIDEERTAAMIDISWKENVSAGSTLIKEGDTLADYFYVVQSGQFDITQAEEDDGVVTSQKVVGHAGPGGCFGELALLYLAPRAATVQAKTDAIVWVFDRTNFKKILLKQSELKVKEYMTFLNQVELLSTMLYDEKRAMAEALVEMHFQKDDVIVRQGEESTMFYIFYEGEMCILKDDVEVGNISAKGLKDAKVFGERALLSGEPRAATCVVKSDTAKALVLDRESFHMLLGPLEDIIMRGATGLSKLGKDRRRLSVRSMLPSDYIEKKDLKFVALLGTGGFGAVELVEHVKTKKTYALKMISKGYIIQTGMQASVNNERDILLMTESPFIVTLHYTYKDAQFLYFLLDVCLGGELHVTYNRKNLYGDEKLCKFYAAGVTRGFAHLHDRKIIYRDLKPENLLLTGEGRLVITDMGLAKFSIGKTYSVYGTRDYFAPELIASTGHTTALDWWTLGILIFELMAAYPPFQAGSPMQIYVKVRKGIGSVYFPANIQGPCDKVIRALLKSDPEERLCVRVGGIANMEAHPWYRGFDWPSHNDCTMPPPYTPNVKSPKDASNFSARKEDRPPAYDPKEGVDDEWCASFDMMLGMA